MIVRREAMKKSELQLLSKIKYSKENHRITEWRIICRKNSFIVLTSIFVYSNLKKLTLDWISTYMSIRNGALGN